jgi:hypothetical protein
MSTLVFGASTSSGYGQEEKIFRESGEDYKLQITLMLMSTASLILKKAIFMD